VITSRLVNEIHHIELEVRDAPAITDAFGEKASITGLRITYRGSGREVGVIRFKTADDSDLFVADEDMTPEKWPTWLRDLIDQYRPAEVPGSRCCPDCSAPAVGSRIPTHHPRCPRNDPHF
jgi:hypothetical protein